MIAKLIKGRGFRGALNYLFHGRQAAQHERGRLIGGNMASTSPRRLAAEFAALRRLNPKLGKAVLHASISPSREDRHLTDDEFARIGSNFLIGLGFEDCPFVIVRHDDTANPHIHLIASRIATNGKTVSDAHDFKRAEALLRELETTHRLTAVVSSHAIPKLTRRLNHQRRRKMNEDIEEQTITLPMLTEGESDEIVLGDDGTPPTIYFEAASVSGGQAPHQDWWQDDLFIAYVRRLFGENAHFHHGRGFVVIDMPGRGKIKDYGDRIEADGMNNQDAAVRLVLFAKAKRWPRLSFSGSEAYVRAAMAEAIRQGLKVIPRTPQQTLLLAQLQAEKGKGKRTFEHKPKGGIAKKLEEMRDDEPAAKPASPRLR